LEPSAKRAEIENRIRTLESAKPVFQAPRLSPRMAEEARKTVRLNAPTPAQPPRAVLKGPEKLVRPPVAPAPAVQPSPRTVIAAAPQAVKPPEKLVRPPVAPAPAAQPSPRTVIAAAPQAVKPPPAAAAPDRETAIRRDLAAESGKQKRKLTPGEIDSLARYKLAHPEARIQDMVANPAAYMPKPPLAIRPAPTLRTQ